MTTCKHCGKFVEVFLFSSTSSDTLCRWANGTPTLSRPTCHLPPPWKSLCKHCSPGRNGKANERLPMILLMAPRSEMTYRAKKKGTVGTELCGVQCALNFAQVCKYLNAWYESLDEWAIAWARWGIAPVHRCDDPADVAQQCVRTENNSARVAETKCTPSRCFCFART